MNIGAEIKKIRRGRDMTQEQLAEYLNVSVSAVSQWESEKTMPDISVIPVICNLFGITSDELLGIDIVQKKAKIKKLRSDISENFSRTGHKKEAHEALLNALREYPDDYGLMYDLASNADWLINDPSFNEEERKKMRDDSIKMLEKILDGCSDDNLRQSAICNLCGHYAHKGEKEKAEEFAMKMPIMCNSRDFLLAGTHGGTEGMKYSRLVVYDLIQFLSNFMIRNHRLDSGELLYSEEELRNLYDKQINFIELMFEKGDYGFYNDDIMTAHEELSKYYMNTGNFEEAISHLEKAAEAAFAFLSYCNEDIFIHTSLLFKNFETGGGASVWYNNSDNSAKELMNYMNRSEFNPIRGSERFKAVEAKLTEYAGKMTP